MSSSLSPIQFRQSQLYERLNGLRANSRTQNDQNSVFSSRFNAQAPGNANNNGVSGTGQSLGNSISAMIASIIANCLSRINERMAQIGQNRVARNNSPFGAGNATPGATQSVNNVTSSSSNTGSNNIPHSSSPQTPSDSGNTGSNNTGSNNIPSSSSNQAPTGAATPKPEGGGLDYSKVQVKGQNYYVDSVNGSDSGDGKTPETAWKSIDRVNQANFEAGDAVNFAKGETFNGELNIKDSGTADNPIIVRSYGTGDKPIIDANQGAATSMDSLKHGATLSGSNVVMDGLNIQGGQWGGLDVTGNNNIITNSEFTDDGNGIVVHGQNNLITQNYIHDLKMVWNTQTSGDGDDDMGAEGVTLLNSDNEVSFNNFVNCKAQSYDYGNDGGAVELFGANNSSIHDNTATNCDGFVESGGGPANNVLISNNTINNCGDRVATVHLNGNNDKYGGQVSNFQVVDNKITKGTRIFDLAGASNPNDGTLVERGNIFI